MKKLFIFTALGLIVIIGVLAGIKGLQIRAMIAKKSIRPPFAGRLGIHQINLGQVIDDGQAIVPLHSLNPIFVNFLLPQQQLSLIITGLSVRVTTDALPGRQLTSQITAINPRTFRDFLPLTPG